MRIVSFLRKPWLLIILILLIPVLVATINSYRHFDLEGMWFGLIIAGIAFVLFGIAGNMVSYMSEKPGSTFLTMNVLFAVLNASLFTVHGVKYYNDNFVEKPFEYYNHFFLTDDPGSEAYKEFQRVCVADIKELTKGKLARITSLSKDEVCDSVTMNFRYTCRIMYQIEDFPNSKKGFLRYYLLDSAFQIVSREEINLREYSFGDSEIGDSLIRQEIKSTLDMGKNLKLVDSMFQQSNFEEYLEKLDQLEEAAQEIGVD